MIFMTSLMNPALASNILFIISFMTVQPTRKLVASCEQTDKDPLWVYMDVPDLGPRHNWTTFEICQIKVAYFYGVVIASPPAGILSEWLGPKNTICFPLLFAGIINVLSPHGAKWGWGVPFACRFIVGLSSGTVYPALQCFVGKWAPPNERGKFLNAFMGNAIGTAVVWVMIQYTAPLFGWHWTFYILSILIGIHCTAFWFLTSNEPEDHRYITEDKEFPPFKDIVTSSECWAATILQFGSLWGVNLQLLLVPIFINQFMGIMAHDSVLIAILPHITRFCSGIFFGNLSDFIRTREMGSNTLMSKILVVFSHIIPTMILMSLGSVKCNTVASILLLIFSNVFTAASVGTNLRAPTDLSPNFAGGAYFATGIIYLWFGSAEIQPWNTKEGRRQIPRVSRIPI
ncbi:hypothetical protein HUJ05_001616 [Dendroctonus ponderosae]|nr:hypothetical protein HUJ05_001616 [Dendroctonus ponderosae]